MNNENPIAIFDSGVGSLSIIKEIRNALPCENYIYLADKKHFPYGKKTHTELLNIVQNTIEYLSKNFSPKLIVLASNTPSIQVLHEIKKNDSEIIGVFPPIHEAITVSKTGHIAILATQNTVKSLELDEYIQSQNIPSPVKITKFNASRMVELVETGDFLSNKEKSRQVISEELSMLDEIDNLVDTITLSSTHLPFLNEYFTTLRPGLHLIDPAKLVAEKATKLLEGNFTTAAGKGRLEILASQEKRSLETVIRKLGIQEEIREICLDF
ncbi:MAG: glutamate racemase [Candidatus Kuenenia sp.]|nr:glutamate racemase [Candidatus Kuenenia hertensis]